MDRKIDCFFFLFTIYLQPHGYDRPKNIIINWVLRSTKDIRMIILLEYIMFRIINIFKSKKVIFFRFYIFKIITS